MNEIEDRIWQELVRRGYRIERSEDGNEERLIRPDGTVAMIARRESPDVKSPFPEDPRAEAR